MSLQNTPNELAITQDYNRQSEARQIKYEGDFNANFTLYIGYTEKAKADTKTWRYCQTEGKRIPVNGFPYYSKQINKPEPSPQEAYQRFMNIISQWTSQRSDMVSHFVIYWNLNKGRRVNFYHQQNNLPFTWAKNVLLMVFNKNGKMLQKYSHYSMINAPTIHTDQMTQGALVNYYKSIIHNKVPEEQAKSIFNYLQHYFGTWDIKINPLVAELDASIIPAEIQDCIQPETPQEPTPQTQPEPQASIAQQVTARTEAYKLPPLQKPKPQAVTQAQKITAEKEIIQGRRQIEEKDKFLQQLACTQTSLKEKLDLYQLIYPADPIFKIQKEKRESFLSEILTAYL